MLLTNKSKLNFYVDIDLTFDDDSNKKTTLNVGDKTRIVFRYNGVKKEIQGEIKSIYPSRVIESNLYGTKKLSAILEIDAFDDYKSNMVKVDISDILDILPLEESGSDNANESHNWNDLSELLTDNNA